MSHSRALRRPQNLGMGQFEATGKVHTFLKFRKSRGDGLDRWEGNKGSFRYENTLVYLGSADVVVGWARSSAYVVGIGIIYWDGGSDGDEGSEETPDGFLSDYRSVPGTAYRRAQPKAVSSGSMDVLIGEVVNYIFLDKFIVFTTHLHKIFAWNADDEFPGLFPIELKSFYRESRSQIQDIQGSFQKFGVFTKDGTVMIGNKGMLDAQWKDYTLDMTHEPRMPEIIPALQNAHVISLAFGDYHFHALHANGTITSYGKESQGCGALGLGGPNVSPLRGNFFTRRTTGDGELQVPAWGDGRRTIWFEEEKARWISDTCQKGATSEASPRASRLAGDVETASLVGEWFEREGRNWSAGPSGDLGVGMKEAKGEEGEEDDGIDAYFALKVAAAGWSSAALVLVNDAKAESIRRKYLVAEAPQKLPNGARDGGRGMAPASSSSSSSPSTSTPTSMTSPAQLGLGQSLYSLGRSLFNIVPGVSSLLAQHPSSGSSSGSPRSSPLAPAAPGAAPVPTATGASPHTPLQNSAPLTTPAAVPMPPARARGVSDVDNDVYVWDDQPFPRLRYPDGSVMPGEVALTPWKGGEPDFGAKFGWFWPKAWVKM